MNTIARLVTDGRNWDTAVGYPDIPVRCRVSGVARNQEDPNNGSHPFEHTYDFFHFKNFISSPDVFEVRNMASCIVTRRHKKYSLVNLKVSRFNRVDPG